MRGRRSLLSAQPTDRPVHLNESVGATMEVWGLLSFLLLLAVQIPPCRPLQDLACVTDYIKNISCTWNSSGQRPEERCILQDKREHGKSCELTPVEGQNPTFRTCQLVFNQVYGFFYKVTIQVACGDSVVTSLTDYRPALNVKMHPPGKPVITYSTSHLNVSWSHSIHHAKMISSYYFQLQFKQSEQLWQNVVSTNLTAKQMSVELHEDQFETGLRYQARVRVKPSESLELKGVWSCWSPTASWKPRERIPSEKSTSGPGPGPELQVTVGLVAAAVVLLVLIGCKYHRAGWVHKLKLPHVPTPSTYFLSLNSVHGGNFQTWLRPTFAPESFDVPRGFEDVSAVEVSKAEDVTALLHPSHPADPWDDSAGSACFSNMGYFYSGYSGSCQIEVCPVYFSSASAERAGGRGAGEGGAPCPAGSSYEQLGDLPGEAGRPDPGSREWSEEDDDEDEEEEEEEEEDTAPGSSNASGPLEGALGRSSSERIEPSSGGYMSVVEMLNTYCNKSI
ncbi:hypothetical protein COCON_G00210120 [Conger conger]|uniref:Interleukin-2 receptor subunit beta n=1 Tax=Conger conger TaxID=82655 RepID=A0A9Q1D036_CONCO|nr:hypothetical protein COCON_G00210120 [Conger conger]